MFVSRISYFLFLVAVVTLLSFSSASKTQAASMTFTPSSTSFKQGCSAKIDLVVDTQGVNTNAVDAVLLFNPSEVEIEDQNPAVPGTQIKTGNVYEIYAGNLVDVSQGKILLTAFSVIGNFNGSGLLGSVYFHSKPGVTATTFQFQFTPGQSTDSNVADTNGNDVLSSVNSGSYSFQSGPCVADTQAPSVSQLNPANNSTDVPLNSNVSLHISDNQSGVDLTTVEIQIHDVIYTSGSPGVTLTGLPLDYAFSINPADDFPADTEIVVVVRATDIDGNVMSPKVYSYNRPPAPPAPPPPAVCGNNVVEEGEDCEPAGTFACSAECKTNIVACLTLAPEALEEAALEAQEAGLLNSTDIGAISSVGELAQRIRSRLEEKESLVSGVTAGKAVEYLTKSTQTVVQSLGCTENCVKILYGENSQRWYVPVGLFAIILLLLALLISQVAKRLNASSKKAVEMDGRSTKRKKTS